MSTINPIHTPCKNCTFAKYDDNTQTDCHLDYISLYKNKNIEIIEAYDNEKEFFIINNKKCVGYREKSWFEKRKMENLSIEEKVAKFKENNFLHYLMCVDLQNFTQEDLSAFGDLFKNLSIKPRKIIFIRYQNHTIKFSYDLIQKTLDQAGFNGKWRIQTMLIDKDYRDILHEITNLNKKYRFILSINSFCNDLETVVSRANKIVYENMDRFIAIRNVDKSAILYSTPNYRHSLLIEHKDILEEESYHIIV
jgi:hypothetical protein